jgi:hypothetical protein
MERSPLRLAQPGTGIVRRSTLLWLALVAVGPIGACADELGTGAEKDAETSGPDANSSDADAHAARPDTDASESARDGGSVDGAADRDADLDADALDADSSVSADAGTCGAASKQLADFIAAHRSCSVDSDCAIVGDCSHADFQAVQRAHRDEAQSLALQTCGSVDGPTYNAVCKAGQCERLRSVAWCGGAPQTECPAGTKRRYPGCSEPAPPSFAEGCFADCSGVGSNAGCPMGYTCQSTSIDPCHRTSAGEATCDACGQEVTLCLPAPACEVELAVGFDYGKTLVTVPKDQSTQLELWLTNKTDRTLSLSFDLPCPGGPVVSGLGDYDLWNSCLAGVCAEPTQREQLSLKPKEKLRWRTAVVRPSASSCNQQGLALGTYAPTFSLGISGAVSCGPAAAGLIVSP